MSQILFFFLFLRIVIVEAIVQLYSSSQGIVVVVKAQFVCLIYFVSTLQLYNVPGANFLRSKKEKIGDLYDFWLLPECGGSRVRDNAILNSAREILSLSHPCVTVKVFSSFRFVYLIFKLHSDWLVDNGIIPPAFPQYVHRRCLVLENRELFLTGDQFREKLNIRDNEMDIHFNFQSYKLCSPYCVANTIH